MSVVCDAGLCQSVDGYAEPPLIVEMNRVVTISHERMDVLSNRLVWNIDRKELPSLGNRVLD